MDGQFAYKQTIYEQSLFLLPALTTLSELNQIKPLKFREWLLGNQGPKLAPFLLESLVMIFVWPSAQKGLPTSALVSHHPHSTLLIIHHACFDFTIIT